MQPHVAEAVEKHLLWIANLKKALADKQLPPEFDHAGYDDLCEFGKWLYAQDNAVKLTQAFRRVKDAHYRFHQEAEAVVRRMQKGEYTSAQLLLQGDFAKTSDELIESLEAWQSPL
jgi:hypothetical protein